MKHSGVTPASLGRWLSAAISDYSRALDRDPEGFRESVEGVVAPLDAAALGTKQLESLEQRRVEQRA